MRRLALGMCALALGACDSRSPREDYDDYRSRTRQARESACTAATTGAGVAADIEGEWLLNALLKGGISLGLRIVFDEPVSSDEGTTLAARIWLAEQSTSEPPLVETTTLVGPDGTFELVADPLDLGTDVIESEAAVVAVVTMASRVLSGEAWCGTATGGVTSPLQLKLDGSTFYAARDDDRALALETVPFECPGDPCAADMGVDAEVADMGLPDGGPVRPASPDLSDVASERRDLTGEYFFNASLKGIPVRLWLSLIYRETVGEDGAVGGAIDGTLRAATDPLDAPARTTFFSPIDEEGRFEIWLPDFVLSLDDLNLEVSADILLAAATVEGGWCGVALGQARSPFMLDLAGSTFFSIPWATPGGERPEEQPNACPTGDE